jgi:tetratricopeptide (TPR) repeat protein
MEEEYSQDKKLRFMGAFDVNAVSMNIELSSKCNLRCIGCSVAKPQFRATRHTSNIDMDRLLPWVAGAQGRIAHVRLYHMGETWAHPRWAELTRFLKAQNPHTTLFTSTNGMPMLRGGVFEELPTAGLDHIMFSIHGVRQETAERYMGSAFRIEDAFEAVRQTDEIRRRHALSLHLSWKYLLFEWNDSEDDIRQAMPMAEQLGFDEIHFTITSQPAPSKRFAKDTPAWLAFRRTCAKAWQHAAKYQEVNPMTALHRVGRHCSARPAVPARAPEPAIRPSEALPQTAPSAPPTIAAEALRRVRDFLKVGLLSNVIEKLSSLRANLGDTSAFHHILGDAEWSRRDAVAAADHYRIALQLAGDEASESLLSAYARSLRATGRFDEARTAYERAIRVRNLNGGRAYGEDIYLGLSQTFQAMGQREKADVAWGQWVEQTYLVEHGTKVVYCPIAKNASTFLKAALVLNSDQAQQFVQSGRDGHVFTRKPRSGFHLGNRSLLGHQKYFSFIVLRDPFERALSAYFNIFVRPLRWRHIPDVPARDVIFDIYAKRNEWPAFSRSVCFSEFVYYLCTATDLDMDHHWRPQHCFFGGDLSPFDFIGRVEDMETTISVLERRARWRFDGALRDNATHYGAAELAGTAHLALPRTLVDLPVLPRSQDMYAPELRERVATRYGRDFDCYADRFGIELRDRRRDARP